MSGFLLFHHLLQGPAKLLHRGVAVAPADIIHHAAFDVALQKHLVKAERCIRDSMKFNGIMQKTNRGEELTPQESIFKSAYLARALRGIGDSFAQYYAMLNEEGQKKADEEITRTIKQLELLTKIPEYRKKD